MDGILARADSGGATVGEAIEQLLDAQIVLRNNRRLETAMRSSRLPAVKTLAQSGIKREQVESLHELVQYPGLTTRESADSPVSGRGFTVGSWHRSSCGTSNGAANPARDAS